MDKILEIHDLHSGYDQFDVLKGVSLTVYAGEVVALIGPNGAGKSTVIKSIFSLANVKKGKILFEGKDIAKLKTYELMNLGISYVSQGRINFNNLTVKENLIIGSEYDKEVLKKRLASVYKRFPVLKERENSPAYQLSGGQAQMLAIGRALMHDPKVMLLDEPSLGLSPLLQKQLFNIVNELSEEGIAVLMVEQNARQAIEIAHRTYVLEDGKVALSGGKEIVNHPMIKRIYMGGR